MQVLLHRATLPGSCCLLPGCVPDLIKSLPFKNGFNIPRRVFLNFRHFTAFLGTIVHLGADLHKLPSTLTNWSPNSQRNNPLGEVNSTGHLLAKHPLRHISASYPHHQCWLIQILVPLSFSIRILRGRALMLLSTRFSMGRPELLRFRTGHLVILSENFQLTDASSSS